MECQDDACQITVAAHSKSNTKYYKQILSEIEYTSTTILLDSEDSSFIDTLVLNEATSSGLTTSDNGKTWTVDTININEHTFDL